MREPDSNGYQNNIGWLDCEMRGRRSGGGDGGEDDSKTGTKTQTACLLAVIL